MSKKIREFVYFSPCYGGFTGVLTIYLDGFTAFEIETRSGPCNGKPEDWKRGKWERVCEL